MRIFIAMVITVIFTLDSRAQFGNYLDSLFGNAGRVQFTMPSDQTGFMYLQSDGKIVAVGDSLMPNYRSTQFSLYRLQTNGSFDSSFNNTGEAKYQFTQSQQVSGVVVLPDGKILVSGYTISPSFQITAYLIQFQSNGRVDSSFGSAGRINYSGIGFNRGLTVQPDGKLLLIHDPYTVNSEIIRLNSNGSFDNSFDADGRMSIASFAPLVTQLKDVHLQPDGKILAAGYASVNSARDTGFVARITSGGTLDASFGTNGVYGFGTNSRFYVNGVFVQADGRILATGYTARSDTNEDIFALRINANGTTDSSFGRGFVRVTTTDSSYEYSNQIISLADGSVMVVGASGQMKLPHDSTDISVWKFRPNGLLDSTYGVNGRLAVPLGGEAYGRTIIESGSRIYVAGSVTNNNGYRMSILALKPSCVPPIPVITPTADASVCQGSSVLLSSSAALGNQWLLNGVAIPGATAQTLSVNQPGSYSVQIGNGNCWSTSSPRVMTVRALPTTPTISVNGNVLTSSSPAGNQWFLNGSAIAGATGATYTALQAGTHQVQVTANGCSSALSTGVAISLTSINSPTLAAELKIGPNPVQQFLYIKGSQHQQRLEALVFDLNGRQVVATVSFMRETRLDFSSLKSGYYTVQVIDNKSGEHVHQLVYRQ